MKCSALTLACCVLLAACAAPAPPPEPAPPVSLQAPSAAAAALPVATTAAAPTAPRATPLPRGKRLREVWPQPLPDARHVTALLYSDVQTDDSQKQARITYSFWQTDLNIPASPKRVFSTPCIGIPCEPLPMYAELSPNGAHIAYLLRLGDGAAELHIVRSDGSNDRIVAAQVSAAVSREKHIFAWSPDSTLLAFIQAGDKGQTFFVADVQAETPPKQITQVGGAALVGWRDNQHVLTMLVTDQQRPLQLTTINRTTLVHKALAVLPRGGNAFATASPDATQVLVSEYLLNLTTRQFVPVPTDGGWMWSPDGQQLISAYRTEKGNNEMIAANATFRRTPFTLLNPAENSNAYDIVSIAPDRRYLAICERYAGTGRASLYRLSVYNILQDQWTPIGERPYCLQVLGWQ